MIQPTPFCNIDCTYCYLPERSNRAKLSEQDVVAIFERLLTFVKIGPSNALPIVWHAGEPLALGARYYETIFAALETIRPSWLKFDHAFQTNGILINDDWCDLFKKWDVGVGVSIDGPKHIHDLARRTRAGAGTHEKVMQGVRRLQSNGVTFYVIAVLTRAALLEPDAIFDFFRECEIYDVGFNIEEIEGINKTSSLDASRDEGLLVNFYGRFAHLITRHKYPLAVRELDQAMEAIQFSSDEASPINDQTEPLSILTIDVKGNLYTFSPELAGYSAPGFSNLSIGNLLHSTTEDIVNSPVLARLAEEIGRGVEMCRSSCEYFRFCGGGAPSNKIFENGTFASTETAYCRFTKKIPVDFVLRSVESKILRPSAGDFA